MDTSDSLVEMGVVMKVLIVDNEPESPFYAGLQSALEGAGWKVFVLKYPADVREACISNRPDIVALDIALNKEEESLLISCKEKGERCPAWSEITGMRLCYEITSEFRELPVALLTKHELINLATEAFAAGAWQFLLKSMGGECAGAAIRNMVRTSVSADAALYEVVSEFLDKGDAWEAGVARIACERFYHVGSASKRFVALCASLAPLFGQLFDEPQKHLTKYLAHMVNSHSLLGISDPSMWDHVRHSGNVFWTGYLLLNKVPGFRTAQDLPGYNPNTYGKSGKFFDELMTAWTLASLFHDIGLAMEKNDRIVSFIMSALGPGEHALGDLAGLAIPGHSISRLQEYFGSLGDVGKKIDAALQWIIEHWGRDEPTRVAGENRKVVDHGILGATRMLDYLEGRVSLEKWPICLHAAAAVALHNLPSLQLSFPVAVLDIEIPMGLLPVGSLLVLCDTVQNWDREQDPGNTPAGDTLLELLGNQERAYIEGSEIIRFSHEYDAANTRSLLTIETRYFLRRGDQLQDVCNMFRSAVLGWAASGKARLAAKTFQWASQFHCRMKCLLPFADPVEIEF